MIFVFSDVQRCVVRRDISFETMEFVLNTGFAVDLVHDVCDIGYASLPIMSNTGCLVGLTLFANIQLGRPSNTSNPSLCPPFRYLLGPKRKYPP